MTTLLNPSIAIPARNEEDRLPKLIQALGQQSWLANSERQLPVTIVLNNCTDGSAEAVRLAARREPRLKLELIEVEFLPEAAHVGSARRLAVERALAKVGTISEAAVITSDADSVPAPDWVEANLSALAEGVDLVGGLISGDEAEEAALGQGFLRRAQLYARYASLADRLASLIDPLPYDPWPRHHDHTGASLAVRGSVLQAIGGFPALAFREDLGMVSLARGAGFLLRHDPAVRVQVSARLQGRAPGGMADTIRAWVEAETCHLPQFVEAPESIESRALRRSVLRNLRFCDSKEGQVAARQLGIDPAQLESAHIAGLNGIALAERFAPDEPDAPATVLIEPAIDQLTQMISTWESTRAAA